MVFESDVDICPNNEDFIYEDDELSDMDQPEGKETSIIAKGFEIENSSTSKNTVTSYPTDNTFVRNLDRNKFYDSNDLVADDDNIDVPQAEVVDAAMLQNRRRRNHFEHV